jgi:hypothetical protein
MTGRAWLKASHASQPVPAGGRRHGPRCSRGLQPGGDMVLDFLGVYSRAAYTEEGSNRLLKHVNLMIPCHELEVFAGRRTRVGCGRGPQSWHGSCLDRHSSDGSDGGISGTGVHNGTSSRHRCGITLLGRAHIGQGWHDQAISFLIMGLDAASSLGCIRSSSRH